MGTSVFPKGNWWAGNKKFEENLILFFLVNGYGDLLLKEMHGGETLLQFKVGNGDRIKFRKDPWCSEVSLEEAFPLLFQISVNQDSSIAENFIASGDSIIWTPLCRRSLFDWEVEEYAAPLGLLQNHMVDLSLEDEWNWKWNADGCFSVKSMVLNLYCPGQEDFLARQIWNSSSPSKINFLVWTMALDKCLTRVNLERRGIQILDLSCGLCGTLAESIEHLCIHCPISSYVWGHFLKALEISWVMPNSMKELLNCWRIEGLSKKGKLVWNSIPAAVLWSIWTERNNRIFCCKAKSPDEIVQRAVVLDDIVV
ncbi:PREDICTED: uncharacterized protein LOC104598203 [Nelumbo nucifera]|uniref:Uncharacterized protein LOC104598203 n=1 Tax=Nelumbo nucifera TaxID=4432 RepID=A0A1U8A8X3_NELNU|nr:PREDICTED: uncharacterized protein LOC104598203 [Nelumbo nucifera]